MEDLSPAEQQMVEIAKALSSRARVLVLDEPTSALDRRRDRGAFSRDPSAAVSVASGIVYISHRMAEDLPASAIASPCSATASTRAHSIATR